MAADFHMTDSGDIAVSSNGDIAITSSNSERIRQQAHLRLVTETGDFVPYPKLGANLQRLIGLPNTEKTGNFGKDLIERALTYDGFVTRGASDIEATPTAYNEITFEVKIPNGVRESLLLTLTQVLTI